MTNWPVAPPRPWARADKVSSAIVQVAWTGDKESMIALHEKYVEEATTARTCTEG